MKIALISVFAICLVLAFLAERLPFLKSVKAISIITKNSLKTIKSGAMADEEKEKRLLSNSWQIFWRSGYILGLALVLLIAGYLLLMLIDWCGINSRPALLTYLGSREGIFVSLAAFLTYFLVRKIYVRVRL